ncbi:DMT family transporter [Pseudodesulfovibrio sp.]|uniref:DMT family transporter n=1 Tax=unclassified Pseudodesulfovibrio TaxID=2661612 RepID=UPI003B002A4C
MQQKSGVYALLIISMALWGGTWVAGRVVAQSMHPMSAAALRFIVASLGLIFMVWRSEGHLPRLKPDQVLPVIFLGFTGVFAYSYFFFTGLQTTPAGRAALIVACIPVCISIAAALFLGERFGPVRVVGALLSLAGVSVVLADGNPLALLSGGVNQGDLMILGCVASWTAYTLGGRKAMRRMPPLTAVTWSCIMGTAMLLPVSLTHGLVADTLNARLIDWGCIFFLGALATSLAYFWYYQAIAIIGASRAGIFINTVPVFAVVMGCVLLGEPVHPSLVTGGAMVIAGVYLTNRP